MVRVSGEQLRLLGPCFADELVGCEPSKRFESPGVVVSGDEVGEVDFQLPVVIVVAAQWTS